MFPPVASRGGQVAEEEIKAEELCTGDNIFLIFGCEARKTVPAVSTIANTFF